MWVVGVTLFIGAVLQVSDGSQELQSTDGAQNVLIDWTYQGSSITKNEKGEFVFSVKFKSSSLEDLIWRIERLPILESNKDFSINLITSAYGNRVATLTAHVPDEKLFHASIHFTATVSTYQNEMISITVRIRTGDLTLQNEASNTRFKYRVNRSRSNRSLDQIITVVPLIPSGAQILLNRILFASYHFLNVSGGREIVQQVTTQFDSYNNNPENEIAIQNVTSNDGPLQFKLSIDNILMPYNGDLLFMVPFDRIPGVVSEISLFFMLPFVFTGSSPAGGNLNGKFAIYTDKLDFSFRENYPDSIFCHARGYPPPELYIKRLNNDGTITRLSFGSGHLRYFPESHTSVYEVVIPKAEKYMTGEYYCYAEDMSQGRFQRVTLYLTVMFPARFDHAATSVETLPNHKKSVTITATGKPIPVVTCMMNDRHGEQIYNGVRYGITMNETSVEGINKKQVNIGIDPAYNGTTFTIHQLECRASSLGYFGSDKDDWMTVQL